MEAVWFAVISTMLAMYALCGGLDFGIGILHHFVAKNDSERRTVLASISLTWNANEVWLIAAGGILFMAFPETYATAFSGFYLALMIVLWLLILRGLAIEFRSHQENLVWRQFWDAVFSLASALLAIVCGTTLGNLIRGVPLDAQGLQGMPLFTNFLTGSHIGIFDWYTLLVGLFSALLLAGHAALFLVWRTNGNIQLRSREYAQRLWRVVLLFWTVVTAATIWLQHDIFLNIASRPWTFAFVALACGGIGGIFHFQKSKRDLPALLSSSALIAGLMGATLSGNYPFWLRSTVDRSFSLTAHNTVSSGYGLRVALGWAAIGMAFVIGYFAYLFFSIQEKAEKDRTALRH